MASEDLGTLLVRISTDTTGLQAGVAGINSTLTGFGNTVSRVGGLIAAAFAVDKIKDFATAAVGTATEFQTQMANVSTLLTGDTDIVNARIGELGDAVEQLQVETGTAAEDLTSGLYQVISAFGDTADSAAILQTAVEGAAAGGASVEDAVNLISAVTKGFGDTSAEAAQKASDLAFETVRLGQTTFPELAASIGHIIPIAAALGSTEEEVYGAMATLTGVTGDTAEVATQLRATYSNLLDPSDDMAAALKSIGYESGAAAIEGIGLNGTLQALLESVDGDTIAFANMFDSVRAQTGVLALAGAQADNFTEKTEAMYDAAGATQIAFEKMQATFETASNRLTEAGNVIMNHIGQAVLPALSDMANAMADLLSGDINTDEFVSVFSGAMDSMLASIDEILPELLDKGKALITVFVQGIIQVLPTLLQVGGEIVYTIVEAIVKSLPELLESGMKMLETVMTGIAKALPEAVDNLASLILELAQTLYKNAPEFMSAGIMLLQELVRGILSAIPELITNVIPVLLETGKGMLKSIVDGITSMLPSIIPEIVNIVLTLVKIIYDNFPEFVSAGMQLLQSLAEGIINAIPILIGMLPEIIDAWSDFINTSLPEIIKTGTDILLALIDGVMNAIPDLVEMLPQIIETIVDTLLDNLPDIIKAGVKILIALINGLIEAIPQLIAMLPTIITTIINTLIDHIDEIIQAGVDILLALIDGMINSIPDLILAIPQIVTAIFNAFEDVNWLDIGVNIVIGIWNGIKSMATWFSDKLSSWLSGLKAEASAEYGIGVDTTGTTTSTRGARASGGPVLGNASYLVGERGPEIFTPNSNGTIIPNDETTDILGKTVISFENMVTGNTFYIRSDDDITRLAQEFYSLTTAKERSVGVMA